MKKIVSILTLILSIFAYTALAQTDLFDKGVQQYDAKQYEQAAETFKQVIAQTPKEYAAYYNLGLCYYFLNRYDEALIQFQQSVNIKPDYAKAYYYLGNTQAELKRDDDALFSYQKAIRNDPKLYQAQYEAGNILVVLRRFPEAITAFNEAIRLHPNYPEAYLGLGNAYYNDKRYAESIKFYQKSVDLLPTYVQGNLFLADAFLNSNQYASAVAVYKKVILLDSKNVDAYYGLGLTYSNQKNSALAREQVTILRTLDPEKAAQLEQKLGVKVAVSPKPTPTPKPVPKTAQRLKDEQDVAKMNDFGFDGALVTGVASIRETPKATGKVLLTVKRGDILSLSSREPDGSFYQVVEEKSGIEGWIDGKSVIIKLTGNTADNGPPLEESDASTATANPVVSISNLETKTTLNMRINGTLYKIPPQTTKTISVPAGKFTYYGWSPGIRPTSGSKTLEKGKDYKWEFQINRR